MVEKYKKKDNISYTQKLQEVQVSMPVNKVLLEHSHTYSFT